MPLLDDPLVAQSLLTPRGFDTIPGTDEETHPAPAPAPDQPSTASWDDITRAALRSSNSVVSAISKMQDTWGVNNELTDPNYSPWKDVVGTPYEKYWQNTFAYSNNASYTAALKRSIDRQQADERTVAAGGWQGTVSGIIAGTIDPTLLVPGGGEIELGGKGIWTIGRGLASGARAGAIGMTAQELALHGSQDIRTPEQSLINIGTGTVLGAVVGGTIASALTRTQRVASEAGLEAIDKMNVPPELASVGAAGTYKPTIDDLTIEGAAARNIAAATAMSPNSRAMFYESPLARQTIAELSDIAPVLHMHTEGKTLGGDVTTNIGVSLAETLDQAITKHLGIYADANKSFNMSKDEFNNAVGDAMRNNDVGVNEAVSKSARMWRDTVTQPLLDQAIALKMLPEDISVSEAPSYFSRDWNKEKLIAQTPDVLDRFAAHFKEQLDNGYQAAVEDLANRHAELGAEAQEIKPEGKGKKAKFSDEQKARLGEIEAEKKDLFHKFSTQWERRADPNSDITDLRKAPDFSSHARDLAREVHQRLTGQDYGSNLIDPEYSRPIAMGPLKGRTFHIPDARVTVLLNSNVMEVMNKFSRRMAAQIELTRKFGNINLADRVEQVGREYQTLTEHAASEAERSALAKDQKNWHRDVIALRDMHLGTYMAKENASTPGRVARALKNVNFILRMGGPALPHVSNIYAPALFHGPLRYMQDGIGPLVKGLDALGPMNKEARYAVGLEGITHHQLLTVTALGDPYAKGTRFERLLDNTTKVGSKLNGLNILIDAQKNISSWINQARLNDALLKGGDEQWLAYSGLTKAQQGNAAKFLQEYGTEEGGHLVANTDRWIEEGGPAGWEAARAYRVAIAKNVNNDIVSRSPGDLPLIANTPIGSLFFQFRTFQLIAHQRMLLRVLQLPKARAISGMMGLTAIGMMAATIKAWRSGQEGWDRFKTSAQNPGYLVAEGLDNTAFFTLPTQVGDDIERVSGSAGHPVNPVKLPLSLAGQLYAPDAPTTANTQQGELSNDWTSIGGPTVSLGADIIHGVGGPIVAQSSGKPITKREVHAAQRLVPFGSYVGMREFLQYLSDESPYTSK